MIKVTDQAGGATITLLDTLNSQKRGEFHATYMRLIDDPSINGITLDLTNVRALPSEAIGMIVMFMDAAALRNVKLSFRVREGQVAEAFRTLDFDKRYPMEWVEPLSFEQRIEVSPSGRFIDYRHVGGCHDYRDFEIEHAAISGFARTCSLSALLVDVGDTRLSPHPGFAQALIHSKDLRGAVRWRIAFLLSPTSQHDRFDDVRGIVQLIQAVHQEAADFSQRQRAEDWLENTVGGP